MSYRTTVLERRGIANGLGTTLYTRLHSCSRGGSIDEIGRQRDTVVHSKSEAIDVSIRKAG